MVLLKALLLIILKHPTLKYYLALGLIILALAFYFFFLIMYYLWPIFLLIIIGGSVYLHYVEKKKNITYFR